MTATGERSDATATAREMRRLAWFLDDWIHLPGGHRIGLDGIIGLIPGVGDAVGLSASCYMLLRAKQCGVPRIVLVRMVGNVLLDSLVGLVPVLGDLFDFAFKANRRNLALMEQYLVAERQTRRNSWIGVSLTAIAGLLFAGLLVFLASRLMQWIWSLVTA